MVALPGVHFKAVVENARRHQAFGSPLLTRFIFTICCRCIKPNPGGVPGQWDAVMVLEQLRAGGVLEAVRIACAGL